jgi:steroid delta-isomerase-like uncharacterized protein
VATHTEDVMPHPNIELIETWAVLMNTQDMDSIRRIYATDAVLEDVAMGTRCRGHGEINRFFREIVCAFPDYRVTLHAAVADELVGGVEYNFSGTHLGDAWGIPPTHRRMDIRGATLLQFVGGLIRVQHDYWSLTEYYDQLGISRSDPAD